MKTEIKTGEERNQLKRPALSKSGHRIEDNASTAGGSSRREFLQTVGLMSGAAAAVMLNMVPDTARAADVVPNALQGGNPYATKDNPHRLYG